MVRRVLVVLAAGAMFVGLTVVVTCKPRDQDDVDAGAPNANDGIGCSVDSACRDGGVCLNGVCLGVQCTCKTQRGGDILGIPVSDPREVCSGDCRQGWACGVPVGLAPEKDAGPQIVLRCVPECDAGCPDGFECSVIDEKVYPTCVLIPPTAVIEGPTGPVAEKSTIALAARDTSRFAKIEHYAWRAPTDRDTAEAEGASVTFAVPDGADRFEVSLIITDTLGGSAYLTHEVSVCSTAGKNCSSKGEGGYRPCCEGLTCKLGEPTAPSANIELCRP